jgi:hypothetical protein
MDKKKPIGYSKKDTSEMKALIERTEPKSGDYVGSGTVTEVPKKKKKMKRMQMGGMASLPVKGAPDYTTMPIRGPGGRVRGGGGVPVQGPGGVVVPPMSPESKGPRGMMRGRFMDKLGMKRTMKGGGLARKGVGMALAKGGLVKANGCAQRGKSKGKMV